MQAHQAPSAPSALSPSTGAPQSVPSQQPSTAQSPVQALPAQSSYTGPVIVLDPAHGGTDPGARGQNGPIEKDVTLQFARVARVELVRQGYHVVMTRDDDSNPSYDDRAAFANSYHDAIFITLHISSTGTAGTARTYFYQFWSPFSPQSKSSAPGAGEQNPPVRAFPPLASSLIPWNEAQRNYADASHRLADQLQIQLAQPFTGSPAMSKAAAVRGLRSVAAPAVAIEISSVADSTAASFTAMATPLAVSISKGIQSFRPANSAGAK